MKKVLFIISGFFCSFAIKAQNQLYQYIQPIIGTEKMGHTFPRATVPFGSVQLSPETDTLSYVKDGKYNPDVYKYCAGYQYSDKTIVGFSHTHFSGTGHGDLGDFLIMPTTGKLQLNPGTADKPEGGYRSAFSHKNEVAEANYYNVKLDDDNIVAELTTSRRVGFHQYTFPASDQSHIILDLISGIYNYPDKDVWTFVRVVNDTLVTGFRQTLGWARTRTVYFAMTFSQPFISYGDENYDSKHVYKGFWGKFDQSKNFPALAGRKIRPYFNFKTREGEKIKLKFALSPVSQENALNNLRSQDAYRFYLDAGPLKNFNQKFLHSKSILWNEMMEHPTYDNYWKIRNPVRHLQNVKPAVLTVGGWFDQEDPYGPLKVFEGLEKAKPTNENTLVMGPWFHGEWSRRDGDVLGDINFGSKTGVTYRTEMELPFFLFYLKDAPDPKLPKAYIFETGSNQLKKYNEWPPENAVEKNLYLRDSGRLSFTAPETKKPVFAEYISDPSKPVPYSAERTVFRGYKYMVEDQRFAFTRPDVITFETETLPQDVTIAGHLTADLFVSSTGTDADFIVKLIDQAPQDGYQLMVRGEVMRAKFRKSFSVPVPLVPNKISEVEFDMQDASHCFLKGHRIMVQIQSSWFPLVDRNPQTFTNIYTADKSAFQKATNRVYFSKGAASHIKLELIPTDKTK